jgi:hypothetical protein
MKVAAAMCDAYRNAGLSCTTRVARPDLVGTRVETAETTLSA